MSRAPDGPRCPVCSRTTKAGTEAAMAAHIRGAHPDEDDPKAVAHNACNSFTGVNSRVARLERRVAELERLLQQGARSGPP